MRSILSMCAPRKFARRIPSLVLQVYYFEKTLSVRNTTRSRIEAEVLWTLVFFSTTCWRLWENERSSQSLVVWPAPLAADIVVQSMVGMLKSPVRISFALGVINLQRYSLILEITLVSLLRGQCTMPTVIVHREDKSNFNQSDSTPSWPVICENNIFCLGAIAMPPALLGLSFLIIA